MHAGSRDMRAQGSRGLSGRLGEVELLEHSVDCGVVEDLVLELAIYH